MDVTSEIRRFHAADYAVMGTMFAVSIAIGVYHSVRKGGQTTSTEYLMAGRSMPFLPVALSVLASFFSASTLLGMPAEIYLHGTQYWISVFCSMLTPITGALVFGPMFFRLNLISVYQYLHMRYDSLAVRLFGASLFIVRATIGMGIVLFGPCIAINAVTEFPVWAAILILGGVCTLYTFLGGLKAVIWTDVFQTFIMIAGMLAVIIQGIMNVGGISVVWNISQSGDRIELFNFDPDPTVRHTFWSLTIGIYFVWLFPYTVDQQMVQRFSSAKSLRHAKIALLCNAPGMFILITLCSLLGLVLYANFATCDPLKAELISNSNQLLPLFVIMTLNFAPGLPGLIFSSLFSGALSSVSSMLNSLATVAWEDFLKLKFGHISDIQVTRVTKALVVFFGALGIGMAFLVEQLRGTVLQMSLTLNGAAGAPLIAIFFLGAIIPWANKYGAIVGGLSGFAFSMWLGIGKYTSDLPSTALATDISGCISNASSSIPWNVNNTVYHTTISNTSPDGVDEMGNSTIFAEPVGIQKFYMISYLWLTLFGLLVSMFVGCLVSLATGSTKAGQVDRRLLLLPTCSIFSRHAATYDVKEREPQEMELSNRSNVRNRAESAKTREVKALKL